MKAHDPLEQIRKLTRLLLISCAGNIALLAFLVFSIYKEAPPRPYCELKPAAPEERLQPLAFEKNNAEVLRLFKDLSIEQLTEKLTDTQLVENGFTQRDLALSALLFFHHFDLSRALPGSLYPTQMRKIPLGKNKAGNLVELSLCPGLTNEQFSSIIQFLKREQWPITAQGMFNQLKKQRKSHNLTLQEAFFLTPEFISAEVLLNRSQFKIENSEILNLILQGPWKILSDLNTQQKIAQDLSSARRQRFLLDYIAYKSNIAAYLLLRIEPEFTSKKLDDRHLLVMLELLEEKTPEAERLAKILITSPRSDLIWNLAATRLFQYANEPLPAENLRQAALHRFILVRPVKTKLPTFSSLEIKPKPPATDKVIIPPKIKPPAEKIYTVQEGDSLWKIAKRFKVDIDFLQTYNKLHSDFLKPGTTLKIPNPKE